MSSSKPNIMYSRDPQVFNMPKIITQVEGFYFRTYDDLEDDDSSEEPQNKPLGSYIDNDNYMVNCEDLEEGFEVKITKSGKFYTEIHAANYFIPFIIGNKGLQKKEIEANTKTTIKLPKTETDNIIIIGSTERDVVSARNRINMIILEQRDRHRITHFISIRVFSSSLKENFETFKYNVLHGPNIRGMHPSLFQKSEKLHLTLAPLVLLDDVEIDAAINALHECKTEVLKRLLENVEGPLCIQLEGVEIMNDDPTEVDILYGKVKIIPSKYQSIFQNLVDKICEYFYHKGFIRKQYDKVKLHVTLMNSLFRKNDSNQEDDSIRQTFDASSILEKYANFNFGEVELDFIHLSVRFGQTDNSGDYYYEALTTIPFF